MNLTTRKSMSTLVLQSCIRTVSAFNDCTRKCLLIQTNVIVHTWFTHFYLRLIKSWRFNDAKLNSPRILRSERNIWKEKKKQPKQNKSKTAQRYQYFKRQKENKTNYRRTKKKLNRERDQK